MPWKVCCIFMQLVGTFFSVSVTNLNQGRKITWKNGFIFLRIFIGEKKVEGVEGWLFSE